MPTPIGAILCVGMLALATVMLAAMTLASAFIAIPVEEGPAATTGLPAGGVRRSRDRHYTTAV